jgi:NADPH:quinone reductase-like Zn-dependent oxidoreductase
MCKIAGYKPIVAVVGSRHKVEYCKKLGADNVIDKSSCDLWSEVISLKFWFVWL